VKPGWNIAECVARSDDLEGMQVGTVAAGRTRGAGLRRLKAAAHLKRSGVTGAAHLGLASCPAMT
jgi:hypothetical protein